MNRQDAAWEEGVALGILRELGDPQPPMDAFSLAAACGLRVELVPVREARLIGDVITVDRGARPVRQHGLIAHEIGHWALESAGEPDSESAAGYVGAALMLPRQPFDHDLRDSRWDLRQLRAKHIHCSAEVIARRICALRDAAVAVLDQGRLKTRVVSPWLPPGFTKVSRFERDLAARVLVAGEAIEDGNLTWGFPVFDGNWRRVITIVEAAQLALRY